jgi:hypothetical protein
MATTDSTSSGNGGSGAVVVDELIKQVTAKLGLNEEITRKAIGLALEFLQKNVGPDFDFQQLLQKVQGADTLIARANDPLPEGTSATPAGQTTTSSPPANGGIIGLILWLLTAGPVLDILKKILSLFFGDKANALIESAGDGAELLGKLKGLGITSEQGAKVVTMLVSFLKEAVGPELIDELTEKIPALKSLLGSAKKDE